MRVTRAVSAGGRGGEPAGEVVVQAGQSGAESAVADVAVGADQVVGGPVRAAAQPRKRGPGGVV
jgi:hypothetical protein